MANITNWFVLHKLKPQFVTKIKFICIFGETGNEVLIVTEEDKVYSFGNNKNGCLGLGHKNEIQEPTIVEELCNKQIVNIAYGFRHCIALSKSGDLYAWGNNSYGQLGNGTTIDNCRPSLSGKRIVDICCGANYCLVLNSSGEVYAFGRNNYGQIGIATNNNQLTPIKVLGFDNKKVVIISCGSSHSLVLTESGEVFGWGNNAFGQLGIGNNLHQSSPIKVNLKNNVFVKDIVCGLYHSLILSTNGDIYAFGFNDCGQLGNGNNESQNIPLKINNSNKFTEIATEFWSNISVAVSQNDYCFVWGECQNEEVINNPTETPFKSIHDIFAIHSKRKITYKPIYFEEKQTVNRVIESLSKSFNDPQNSDLKFKIENKYIYVQKWFIKICCKHFERMLSKNWSENETNTIEIKEYSYSVYYAFLKYIYTDCVDIKPEETVDLLDLADCYLEDDLKQKCVDIIKNNITIENFCVSYLAAIKYKLNDFERYCIAFALNNLFDICKTQAFKRMDNSLCKNLLISVAEIA
jgi:RCC1 and BTB domain-containing protein